MADSFDGATYYSTTDPEVLHCETADEAIEECLDGLNGGPTWMSVADNIPKDGIVVTAYRRMEIGDWCKREAAHLVESALSDFDDEFMGEDPSEPNGTQGCQDAIEAALRKMLGDVVPWNCEPCGTRRYTKAELVAWCRARDAERKTGGEHD